MDRSLDVHVSHLRKKLGEFGGVIRTGARGGIPFPRRAARRSRDRVMQLRIRSIFTTIMLWCAATVGLSLVGYIATSILVSVVYSGRDSYTPRFNALFRR